MKKNNSDGPFFDVLREEMRHWPYTLHQIDETLDVGLIEGRGKQLLFQSINSRRLTAFVGAGISVAYGRLSWTGWMGRVLADVERFADVFDAMATTNLAYQQTLLNILERPSRAVPKIHFINNVIEQFSDTNDKLRAEQALRNLFDAVRARHSALDLAQREARKLRSTFDLAKEQSGSFPGGEEAPVKLQFAGQLHDLLHQYSSMFFDHSLYNPKNDTKPKSPKHFGLTGGYLQGRPLEGIKHVFEPFNHALLDFDTSYVDLSDAHEIEARQHLSQLHSELVLETVNYQREFKKYARFAKHQSTKLSFLNLSKNLLVDECAHAEQLLLNGLMSPKEIIAPEKYRGKHREKLRDALQAHLGILDSSNLKRNLDGIRERPERYQVLSAFTFHRLKQLLQVVPQYIDVDGPWKTVLANLSKEIVDYLERCENDGRGQRTFLTPSSRFMIEMLLRLVPEPDVKNWLLSSSKDGQTVTNGMERKPKHMLKGLFNPVKSSDYNSRRSVVAERFDVIPKLVTGLNIKRFLTFNYDFEIERYFQDGGFETITTDSKSGIGNLSNGGRLSDQTEVRMDGVGSVMRDLSFERETASNLIGFTTEADGADAAVYHLHGRATRESEIVVTERDYMDLYIQQDSERTIVDESISLAFSANPILFVGVGMNEGDVLRPLRQFISNHDRSAGYNAMVLLPAEHDFAARSKTSAGLFVRYGVHTIFYGSGEVKIGTTPQTFCAIDWLHRMQKLNSGLKNVIQQRMNGKKHAPKKRLNWLDRHVGKLGANLENQTFGKDTSALAILLGRTDLEFDLNTQLDNIKLKNCIFTSMRPGASKTAHEARKRHRSGRLESSAYTGFYVDLLTGVLHIALSSDEHDKTEVGQRQLAAALSALDGLYGSLLTASLNAALAGISQDHKLWWQDWQQSPPHRMARFEVLPNSPPAGPPEFIETERIRRKEIVLPRRFIRHRIINSITELSVAENSTAAAVNVSKILASLNGKTIRESVADTGVRSLTTFFEAIVATRIRLPADQAQATTHTSGVIGQSFPKTTSVQRRRIHTVAARRGLGKGSFMSALSTRLGLTGYIEAQWGSVDTNVFFLGAVFINLSFSTEIASVYDMVTSALVDACAMKMVIEDQKSLDPDPIEKEHFYAALNICLAASRRKDPLSAISDTLADKMYAKYINARKAVEYDVRDLPRLAKLEDLFWRFSRVFPNDMRKDVPCRSCRFFICISGADLLFTQDKQPKNSEIEDILGFLLSPNTEKLLVDLVLIGSIDGMGAPLLNNSGGVAEKNRGDTEKDSKLKYIRNERLGLSKEAKESIQLLVNTSGIKFESRPKLLTDKTTLIRASGLEMQQVNQVHFMRAAKPTDLLVSNFKPLVINLHLLAYYNRLKSPEYALSSDAISDEESYAELAKSLRTKISSIDQRDLIHSARAAIPTLWTDGKTPLPWNECSLVSNQFLDNLIDRVSEKIGDKIAYYPHPISNTIPSIEDALDELNELGKTFIQTPKNSLKERRESFFRIAAKRYSVDMNTDTEEWQLIRRTLGSNRFSLTILLAAAQDLSLRKRNVIEGAKAAEDFIRSAVNRVRTSASSLREELILKIVFDHYHRFQVLNSPEDNFQLHQRIIRHLAAIGSPVDAAVLVRMPDIRNYFANLNEEFSDSRRTVVARALYVLCERGLVFRLSAHPRLVELHDEDSDKDAKDIRTGEPAPEDEFRYALHRSVHKHVLEKFGTASGDFSSMNNYAPSLYASMPSGLPRLNHDAYQFMSELMASLSQYPDLPLDMKRDGVWTFAEGARKHGVQALRAGLSMVRSSFSIAVVSRFEDYKDIQKPEPRKRSYFDTHKVRLRWIVRKSWELLDVELYRQNSGPSGVKYRPDQEWGQINALYRDEIVWLYNEVGLTCLVQGNLTDAVAHLRQAIEFNRVIEGKDEAGRQHNRIALNLAMTQIERGRLTSAFRRLRAVKDAERERKGRIYHLALGYLGLCDQLMGNPKSAKIKFKKAIKYLHSREDFRACAVLGNHQARLLASTNPLNALRKLSAARSSAEAGGHEDVRRHIIISEVRVILRNVEYSDHQIDHEALKSAQSKLEGVIEYAQLMGIHSLECDAYLLRAMLLMEQNETDTAGKVLIQSIAIAKRNGMNLRLNSAITVYGELLVRRGKIKAAERILYESLEMAKRNSHQTEVLKVQRQLDHLFARS